MPSEIINVVRRDENPDTLLYNSTGFDQFNPPHTSTATEAENSNHSPPQALPVNLESVQRVRLRLGGGLSRIILPWQAQILRSF